MFFRSWEELGRVALLAFLGYLAILVLVRSSGKRTLSSLNVVDLVVTVAIGNILAMTALTKSLSLAEGVLASAVLIGMEYAGDWLASRFKALRRVFESRPVLLAYRGRLLTDTLRKERVTEAEIHAALRHEGLASLQDAEAVILESSGTISVLRRVPSSAGSPEVLRDVMGPRS